MGLTVPPLHSCTSHLNILPSMNHRLCRAMRKESQGAVPKISCCTRSAALRTAAERPLGEWPAT